MGRRAEGAAKVYIKAERGRRRCEIHSKQTPSEEQRPHGLPSIAFFYILTSFYTDNLGSLTDTGGLRENSQPNTCFPLPPFFPSFVSLAPPLPLLLLLLHTGKRRTFHQRIIMLNNMDLNAKDSFYPQFDNCNASSLGMENGARKDSQEVYVEAAERGAPAQFGHGESAVARSMCTHGKFRFVSLSLFRVFFFLSF